MINLDESITNLDELKAYFELHPEEKEFYPQTINELKVWYIIHNLPDENTTRFFIGKDIPINELAFGIYENYGTFIVYKNKRDHIRSIRYSGTNESYAVAELFERLLDEIYNQKEQNYLAKYNLKKPDINKVTLYIPKTENADEIKAYYESHQNDKEFCPCTIHELKVWYISHNLPDEDITKFYIGKNKSETETDIAYGIYETINDTFITYKNKEDHVRSFLYSGHEEEKAVSILFGRLLEYLYNNSNTSNEEKYKLEHSYPNYINKSITIQPQPQSKTIHKKHKFELSEEASEKLILIIGIIFGILFLCGIIFFCDRCSIDGGYYYDDRSYYYDDDDDWDWSNDNDNDNDDDYNWNNDDSWNSNDTDWDSDW